MKAVIQRVKKASVTVDAHVVGEISTGMVVLLGVARDDTDDDVDYMVRKIMELRIFEDAQGKMNLSALETKAQFLVVSQFTLLADCLKGRRPSFDKAGEPKKAEELYGAFVSRLREKNFKVETGIFGAMMDVSLVNDGPVTFVLESRK
jgi:D-aminoacyl-tRNA deacylase